jgi:hypothetical protein
MSMEDVSQQVISRDGPIKVTVTRARGLRLLNRVPYAQNKIRMPPFLGLTQTCRQIRSEYRPWYISRPKVCVGDIQLYIHAFIQHSKTDWKNAFDAYALRSITAVTSSCGKMDLLPLLRLQVLHPSIVINVEYPNSIEPVQQILNNESELWLSWIKTGAMEQAQLKIFRHFRQPRQPLGSIAHIRLHVVLRRQDAFEFWELRLFEMFDHCPAIYVTEGISG